MTSGDPGSSRTSIHLPTFALHPYKDEQRAKLHLQGNREFSAKFYSIPIVKSILLDADRLCDLALFSKQEVGPQNKIRQLFLPLPQYLQDTYSPKGS
jgi:hypothetical protein